jgi:ABC-type Na+ transport system ATPase subunit NatA
MIAIEGLTKVYDSLAAVDDVSMFVEAGALTVVAAASAT